WIQAVIDCHSCPLIFCHINSFMVSIYVYTPPDDVEQVVKITFSQTSPQYLRFDFNDDLYVAAHTPGDCPIMAITTRSEYALPPPISSVFE
ncbi:hypothetical protein V8B97DRAFT_1843150, partial [Scleroderma yunnanense]